MDARHGTPAGSEGALPSVPRDLAAVAAGAALGVSVSVLAPPGATLVRALALPLLLVLPGYAFLAAADPRRARSDGATSLDRLDRTLLSLGLSLGILALASFLVSATPWGLTAASVGVATAGVTLAATAVAARRRVRLPVAERPPTWDPTSLLPVRSRGRGARLANATAVVAVVAVAAAVGYAAYAPQGTAPYTGFAVQTVDGHGHGSPVAPPPLAAGTATPLTLRVANAEGVTATYAVVVTRERVVDAAGPVEVVESVEAGRYAFALADGGTWTGDYRAVVPAEGRYRFTFVLYRDGGTDPYRTLTVWSAA
jgi:uncharacterized membrane protein